MKKENIYKFLYIVSVLLLAGFGIRLGADYYQYSTTLNSAPFYVNVIVRAVEFIVPSILAFIAAIVAKKKYRK